eukprot:jgi/Mesvir1/16786/Mv15158-RA.1
MASRAMACDKCSLFALSAIFVHEFACSWVFARRDFCDTWYLPENELPLPVAQAVAPSSLSSSSSVAPSNEAPTSESRSSRPSPAATHVELGRVSWRSLPEGAKHPPARFTHAYAVVQHRLVIFGGIAITGERLNDTWVCDLSCEPPAWVQLDFGARPCPSARGAAALTSCGGSRAVLFGGISREHRRMDDTWLLDLDGPHRVPSWRQLLPHRPCASRTPTSSATDASHAEDGAGGESQCTRPLREQPPARSGHALAHLGGGRVLMFGGRDSTFHFLDDSWAIDLSQLREEEVDASTDAGMGARIIAQAGVGQRSPIPAGMPTDGGGALDAGGAVDGSGAGLAWCRIPAGGPGPTPRAGHSLVGLPGGRAMLFGGEEPCPQSCSHTVRSNETWVFHGSRQVTGGSGGHEAGVPSPGSWRKQCVSHGAMPMPRAFHAGIQLGGGAGMLVFGGMVSVGGADLENIHASFTFKNDMHALVFMDLPPA